jgi:hypothetical protein
VEEQNECEFDEAFADEQEGSEERNESELGDARRGRHRCPSAVREGKCESIPEGLHEHEEKFEVRLQAEMREGQAFAWFPRAVFARWSRRIMRNIRECKPQYKDGGREVS